MQFVLTRRAALLALVMVLVAGITATPASAQGWLRGLFGTAVVRGTITALDSPAGTFEVTNRDGLSIDLSTNAETQVRRDGRSATLADLRVNDLVLVFYERATRLARRIEAASPPPVELTGTITALDAAAGTIQVTTDHGTQITLTTGADTRVRLNRANTTLGNLALGQRVQATYRPENRIALALTATTPRPDVVSGAITAIDLTAGTLQITPVAGAPVSLIVNTETEFRLNGRRVAPATLVVGLLASVQTQADRARVVAAQTPPLVDLAGTISALDVQGGTLQVTTAAQTTITLRLTPQTLVRRNDAESTAEQLAIGDRVVVRYEYLLLPNQSRALRIVATAAAPTPPPADGAATLTAVAVDPASVDGGAASTGTVTLSAAAPAGGATVNLTSSDPAAIVPASVVVPEGAASATFPVTTGTVSTATPVTITAAFGGATVTAALTVNPAATPTGPMVTAVTVDPAGVDGGAASTGTVTLSAPAPAGGATVTLTSSDAAAAVVPASVVIPEGATSITFPVTTNAVTTATPVTITASFGGAIATATLTVNPPATPTP